MADVWVANASPIITLARVGALALFEGWHERVVVPAEVVAEILVGPPHDPARIAVESGWGERLAAVPVPPLLLEWGLGRGESAVLAVALRDGAPALVDDGEARRCARGTGSPGRRDARYCRPRETGGADRVGWRGPTGDDASGVPSPR